MDIIFLFIAIIGVPLFMLTLFEPVFLKILGWAITAVIKPYEDKQAEIKRQEKKLKDLNALIANLRQQLQP